MTETIPIACSLDETDLRDRVGLMAELGQTLVALEADGRQAKLRFEVDRSRIEEFVRAEARCCAFFDFAVAEDRGLTTLDVGVPESAEPMLRALVAGFVAGWAPPPARAGS